MTGKWIALGCALAAWAVCAPARADIYRYVDKEGVVHFTNVKTDSRYRLFIRGARREPVRFMQDYEGIIGQASSQFGVDSSLIKAVIKAESDFDHRAVSPKGAQGLMQLMPGTAVDMEVNNPFNPEENIFGGTRYLRMMLERFKGDERLALAAYNAGPERVETGWSVPAIAETREFVRRVMRYCRSYRSSGR